jgi:hypothetical protein
MPAGACHQAGHFGPDPLAIPSYRLRAAAGSVAVDVILRQNPQAPLSIGAPSLSSCIGVAGMSKKLGIGDTFPRVTINLVDGRTLDLPDGLDAKYRIFLFYRGHW